MVKLSRGYYHCLECGALFEAALKDMSEQRCSVCGKPPTGGDLARMKLAQPKSASALSPRPLVKLHGVSRDSQDIFEATKASLETAEEDHDDRVRHSKRKEVKKNTAKLIVGVWIVLMIGVVFLVKYLGSDDELSSSVVAQDQETVALAEAREVKNRQRVVDSALPACQRVMAGFQSASSAAGKAQFVYQGVKLSGVMDRHYQNELLYSSMESQGQIIRAELLDGFPMTAIGAICMNKQGEQWEVVFVLDDKEWKIDWMSMVRYDAESWSYFPAGKEGDEGEFRLYMRVRDSNEDFERKEMSLVFYKPTMRFKGEFEAVASSPVSVLIDSDLGRKISELLDNEDIETWKTRKDKHGLSVGVMDPSRYHRVRVRMRLHREGKNGRNSRFELLDILANDWYGVEAIRGGIKEGVNKKTPGEQGSPGAFE